MIQIDSAFQEYGTEEWENQTLNYDLVKYPFPNIVKNYIQEHWSNVDDLSNIHNDVDISQMQQITDHVQKCTGSSYFSKLLDDFAEEYIKDKIQNKNYLIKRYPTLNLVIPNQHLYNRKLPFHQGNLYQNGTGMRTIWMPLTNAYDTNSMQIANLNDSRNLVSQAILNSWDYEQWETACLKISKPVNLKPGQAHLFHQEHIHGNVNNVTNKTRLAIDWHVLIQGESYNGRCPGGFFRMPGDYDDISDFNLQDCTGYTSHNTEYDKNIPTYIQKMVIDKYCNQKNINMNYLQFENEHMEWLPILKNIIKTGSKNIVMFSIHSLPINDIRRNDIFNLVREYSSTIHFASENCTLTNSVDYDKINYYIKFGKK